MTALEEPSIKSLGFILPPTMSVPNVVQIHWIFHRISEDFWKTKIGGSPESTGFTLWPSWVSTPNLTTVHRIAVKIFQQRPKISTCWWCYRWNQGTIKVSGLHSLGPVNVWTTFYQYLSRCRNISFQSKLVYTPVLPSLEPFKVRFNSCGQLNPIPDFSGFTLHPSDLGPV